MVCGGLVGIGGLAVGLFCSGQVSDGQQGLPLGHHPLNSSVGGGPSLSFVGSQAPFCLGVSGGHSSGLGGPYDASHYGGPGSTVYGGLGSPGRGLVGSAGNLGGVGSGLGGAVVVLHCMGCQRVQVVCLPAGILILIAKTPSGVYKLSREAILVAEFPGSFTTRTNWRGSFPRDLLCTFCHQHRLSEPAFLTVNNSLESLPESSHMKLKLTESVNKEINGGGNVVGGSKLVGPRETFRCEVQIFSKCQDLIIKCSPKESFKRQNDAIQNTALKYLHSAILKEISCAKMAIGDVKSSYVISCFATCGM
ncbi:hypothetical protein U1Q18_032806 [Sarracenia purpurea var. burkii]